MKTTVLHVITNLQSGDAACMLERLLRVEGRQQTSQHVVVSLAGRVDHHHPLRNTEFDVHYLNLRGLSDTIVGLLRLILLMRSIKPDVVMTWLPRAHFLGTLATIVSGVGANRLIWNASFSRPGRKKSSPKLRTLAWLSSLPAAIAVRRADQRTYEIRGYRARRWFHLPGKAPIEQELPLYRDVWRLVCGSDQASDNHGSRRRLERSSALRHRSLLAETTFIGVTGSCGKTTTTELVGAVLSSDGACRIGAGVNGLRRVVRNIISTDTSTKYFVQEVSGSYPGRIARQVRVLRPQISVITTVGGDHYKAFRGLEATAKEKGTLVELLPKKGTALLNVDDPHVKAMAGRTRARVITFGTSAESDIRAADVSGIWPDRLKLTVIHGHERTRVQTQFVGEHWTTSVLAAVACGVACGIDLKDCATAISSYKPKFGRYSVHPAPSGAFYVFDHKAPFWTIAGSLEFVSKARAPRRTVVFGTISDYSGAANNRYRRIAREALERVDRVIFVGANAGYISKLREGKVSDRLFGFQTAFEATTFLAQQVVPGELILLKGSVGPDHLERLMLSEIDRVVCWRDRCGRQVFCPNCRQYSRPHQPPFGLVPPKSEFRPATSA